MHGESLGRKGGEQRGIALDDSGRVGIVETGVELRRDRHGSDGERDRRHAVCGRRVGVGAGPPADLDEPGGGERGRIGGVRPDGHRGLVAIGEDDRQPAEAIGSDAALLSAGRRLIAGHVLGAKGDRPAERRREFDAGVRREAVGLCVDGAAGRAEVDQERAAPAADVERRDRRSADGDVERDANLFGGGRRRDDAEAEREERPRRPPRVHPAMVAPPSTTIVCPVMKALAGEAR